jgi:ubiquinone/menaquinone biosynthesis C-methylase UbiE
VFAVDISERSLSALRDLVRGRSLGNVEVVHGQPDDPQLQSGSLDAALIVNAYHDMTQHEAMLQGILKALKPAGRLVVIDFSLRDVPQGAPRSQQTADHELDIDLAEGELRRAGFQILGRHDVFTRLGPGDSYSQWMLIARRPSSAAQ